MQDHLVQPLVKHSLWAAYSCGWLTFVQEVRDAQVFFISMLKLHIEQQLQILFSNTESIS